MEEQKLTKEERHELLDIARSSVFSHLNADGTKISSTLDGLQKKGGVFVTIHKDGNLRGCIGIFTSEQPLYKTVAEMAAKAAFEKLNAIS